jgi:hypothetical protein
MKRDSVIFGPQQDPSNRVPDRWPPNLKGNHGAAFAMAEAKSAPDGCALSDRDLAEPKNSVERSNRRP